MKRIILVFVLISCSFLYAQYLQVSRSAIIKEEPFRDSAQIEKAQKGDYLVLLDNGTRQNGYYKVKALSFDSTGWIYRTLVRRYIGDIPGLAGKIGFSYHFDPIPTGYYTGTEKLKGEDLKNLLNEIIKDHKEYSYDKLWDILKETDLDPDNPSNVIGLYSGFSMKSNDEYDNGKGWNREHVWAKSYGDFGTKMGAGTDLHHLRAEDVSTNSARNNRTFAESEKPYIDKSGTYSGLTPSCTNDENWTWEPRDEVKGDVARMLFYMVVRYEGDNYEPDLELTDTINDKSSKLPQHGKLSELLDWHTEDPVDDSEKYRNHIIFKKYQHNRNPFIDHPEFVTEIWGG